MESRTRGKFTFLRKQRYRSNNTRNGNDIYTRVRRRRQTEGDEKTSSTTTWRATKPMDNI